ncbi:MAG: VanZ family protein [Candidatus Blackburnbacteria bacterium]|nr:VanZ family protein [Candidatus Blackburnbacteria bacterium]
MRFVRYWLPVFLWAGFIFWFSSLPITPASGQNFTVFMSVKKFTHVFEYGLLWLLLYRALVCGNNVKHNNARNLAIILIILWGALDEFHQGLVPGSGGKPHLHDVAVDFAGGGLAYLFIWKLLPKAPKRLKSLAERWGVL